MLHNIPSAPLDCSSQCPVPWVIQGVCKLSMYANTENGFYSNLKISMYKCVDTCNLEWVVSEQHLCGLPLWGKRKFKTPM